MLELVPPGLQLDFIGKARIWISISVVVILIGIASIVWVKPSEHWDWSAVSSSTTARRMKS